MWSQDGSVNQALCLFNFEEPANGGCVDGQDPRAPDEYLNTSEQLECFNIDSSAIATGMGNGQLIVGSDGTSGTKRK